MLVVSKERVILTRWITITLPNIAAGSIDIDIENET